MPGRGGFAVPTPGAPGPPAAARTLLLVLVVGSIFMGTASAIRELVAERAIYRRERSVGLSPTAYLSGKLVVLGLLALLQSGILVGAVSLFKRPAAHALLLGHPTLDLVLVCWVTAFTAAALGLLISGFITTSEQAMPALVVSVMAQMVLSGGLFDLDGALRQVSLLLPGRWDFAAGAAGVDLRTVLAAQHIDVPDDPLWRHTGGTLLLDLGVSLVFAAAFAVLTRWRLARTDD